MSHTDVQNLQLTPEEWGLVAHLLEVRQKELRSEVRHTGRRSYREMLMSELETVDRILVRIPSGKEEQDR
jgi:hypothetical protein